MPNLKFESKWTFFHRIAYICLKKWSAEVHSYAASGDLMSLWIYLDSALLRKRSTTENYPKIIRKSSENHPKIIQIIQKLSKNHLKIIQKSSENQLTMRFITTWLSSENHLKIVRSWIVNTITKSRLTQKKCHKKTKLFLASVGETGFSHDIFFKFSLWPFEVVEVKWKSNVEFRGCDLESLQSFLKLWLLTSKR